MTSFSAASSSMPVADYSVTYLFGVKDGAPDTYGKVPMTDLLFKDASGNVAVGSALGSAISALDIQRAGTATAQVHVRNSAVSMTMHSMASAGFLGTRTNHIWYFMTNDVSRWAMIDVGHFAPATDNAYDIASSGFRIRNLYLANSPIVTSDQREKTWRGSATSEEIAAGQDIIAELGFFQFNDAIAAKGAAHARLHFGAKAQQVWSIMASHGLIEPVDYDGSSIVEAISKYAFLCFDEWPESAGRAAGNRFGVRLDELNAFLIACQQAQINAQEARLAALEAA